MPPMTPTSLSPKATLADLFGPHVPSYGPKNARIFILAEAPGDAESARLRPLVGPSGHELRRMLNIAGINIEDCYRANVFSRQPGANNLLRYGVPPFDERGDVELGPLPTEPKTYLDRRFRPEVERVWAEIREVSPNVILALGNTACWALGLGTGIKSLRGTVHLFEGIKVIPTFHPAAVLRQWDQRVIAIADMEKAYVESLTPDYTPDFAELWLEPSLVDLEKFDRLHMVPARECACDIETKRGQITCISFAPTPHISLAIPFWLGGQSPNYWPDHSTELQAWSYVRRWLEREDLIKVFQNGLYDLQYLMTLCSPRACTEDTMLMHHSLYSELQKGLGFLGSVYTNFPSWKFMRTAKKEDILKRDD